MEYPVILTRPNQCLNQSDVSFRDPKTVSKAYTPDSIWRNRHWFLRGTDDIVTFLTKKWSREKDYRLRKELFAFTDNKIAVQFWYEVCFAIPSLTIAMLRSGSTEIPRMG